jgi:riboflavin biosynthesis pyrimidine reductase
VGGAVFILTHRPEEEPEGEGFTFVNGLEEAIARARDAASGKDVLVMGGADVIRQALHAGYIEELSISIAPITLGGGKRSPTESCPERSPAKIWLVLALVWITSVDPTGLADPRGLAWAA